MSGPVRFFEEAAEEIEHERRVESILVSMTRTRTWALQDAKARFSEVVRKAKSEGPQRITVHGREEVVLISIDEYRRVKGDRSGAALVELLNDSPLGEIKIERPGTRIRVRRLKL